MNSVTWQVSIYSPDGQLFDVFSKRINTGDFTACHCWRSAGDDIYMPESPAECKRLGKYVLVIYFTTPVAFNIGDG